MATFKQLNYGEQGAMVRDFQDALRKVVDSSVGVDGIYGPQTEQFVQKAYNMFPWLSSSARSGVASVPLVAAVMAEAMKKPNSAVPVQPSEKATLLAVAPPSTGPSKGMILGAAAGIAGILWLMLKKK